MLDTSQDFDTCSKELGCPVEQLFTPLTVQAVFIGGTTQWKMGRHAVAVIKTGKMIGKWVHAGRVNSPGRFEYFRDLGADSIDGTGISRYPHMRQAIYKRSLRRGLLDE